MFLQSRRLSVVSIAFTSYKLGVNSFQSFIFLPMLISLTSRFSPFSKRMGMDCSLTVLPPFSLIVSCNAPSAGCPVVLFTVISNVTVCASILGYAFKAYMFVFSYAFNSIFPTIPFQLVCVYSVVP